jgi:hypothetical protein
MARRLTYANVVASIALFATLGGSSYAALKLPTNSVGSRQVKDRSLRARDFRAGQIPAGPQGDKGDRGDKGDPGAPGTAVAYARVIVTPGGASVDPSQSRGVTNAEVIRAGVGISCFRGLGFTPKAIVASIDLGAAEPDTPAAAGALAPAPNVSLACGAGGQAAVATQSAGANADLSYFVMFQ